MPTIGADVDARTKEEFKAQAQARRLTASRLAAALIVEFLKQEQGAAAPAPVLAAPPPAPPLHAARSEQVFVRLAPYYYDQLGRLAAERNWYRGTYLAHLFHAHADRRPVLCDAEINAVRQVARQLADMGRNINQVTKKLNSSPKEAHHAFALELDRIGMLIDLEATMVRNLLRANLKGWGVDDGQP